MVYSWQVQSDVLANLILGWAIAITGGILSFRSSSSSVHGPDCRNSHSLVDFAAIKFWFSRSFQLLLDPTAMDLSSSVSADTFELGTIDPHSD